MQTNSKIWTCFYRNSVSGASGCLEVNSNNDINEAWRTISAELDSKSELLAIVPGAHKNASCWMGERRHTLSETQAIDIWDTSSLVND